jgi:DNA-binding HxlR family transcriptional regulator
VKGFRYAQFCPLARAAEIVGERWTLLVLRELFCGPQRFSDLRRRLPGVSTSVLAERLQGLEERGVIRRRVLEPPAASTVYELDAAGRALERPLHELLRWGVRWLAPVPGDHFEPEWVALGLRAFAKRSPTPARSVELRVGDPGAAALPALRVFVSGGPGGAVVDRAERAVDAVLEAPPLLALAVATGRASARELASSGAVRVHGDPSALDELPGLFDLDVESGGPEAAPRSETP